MLCTVHEFTKVLEFLTAWCQHLSNALRLSPTHPRHSVSPASRSVSKRIGTKPPST